MKSKCGRFEFLGELGILDAVSGRYVSLDGQIQQVKGLQEVQFSDASKKLVSDFIEQIAPHAERIIAESRQARLKSNFFHKFNKVLNEGY